MARFIIYDERAYIIDAQDEDEAFNKFIELSPEDAQKLEVEGGGINVERADY